jgi:hypothetical protein
MRRSLVSPVSAYAARLYGIGLMMISPKMARSESPPKTCCCFHRVQPRPEPGAAVRGFLLRRSLLSRYAGDAFPNYVPRPDGAVEVADPTTALGRGHVAIKRRRIGYDPNRRAGVRNNLRPSQVGTRSTPTPGCSGFGCCTSRSAPLFRPQTLAPRWRSTRCRCHSE